MSDRRPTNCRFRLKEEGKGYPRSSCQGCGKGIMTGLGKSCSYTQQEPPITRADLDAAVALALEGAARLLDKRMEQLVADYGSYEHDTNVTNLPEWVETAEEELEPMAAAIRALIQSHQADALARVRQETWNAAIKAAVAAVPNGWTGKLYQSNIDYGPNTAQHARNAIAALALPVDGGAADKAYAGSASNNYFVSKACADVAHAIRALIQPHQADALARVRQEAHNAAIKAAALSVANVEIGFHDGISGDWHPMGGPSIISAACAAIRALARPVDGGAT